LARKRPPGLAALAVALCLGPALACAEDVIYRADGGRLRGQIVSETSRGVKIKTLGGVIKVPRNEITRIERSGDVFREFSTRKKKLKDYDERAWYELGTWAQDQELYPQAIDCFHKVLEIEPDHEEARWELGYRRSVKNDRWVTEGEYYTEKGYQQWEGRWVPADVHDKLAAGLVKRDGKWVVPKKGEEQVASLPKRKRPSSRKASARGTPEARDARRRRAQPAWAGPRPLGGQVGLPKLTDEQREALLAKAQAGGGWKVGHSSEYYDVLSNGSAAEVKTLARTMDRMCEEFQDIFKFDQEITRPFPIHLYGSQREFMSRTGKGAGVGGYYDGRKIVGFHGKLGSLSTQSVLFHEGTHQFQGLVLGRNMWRAKIWLIEGLAVYFEACEFKGRRMTVQLPKSRMSAVKRAIRAGTYVPLSRLIRMEQAQFGALHYAHAWSLIHFLVNGAKGGKKRFIEYWEKTKEGGYDGVQLFEEIFDKPMDAIEAAWKDYVLNRLGQN
jgi:hypothetical protein